MINPSYAWIFSIPEICETLKGYPAKTFGTVRQKKSTKNCDTLNLSLSLSLSLSLCLSLSPSLIHRHFGSQNFSETQM